MASHKFRVGQLVGFRHLPLSAGERAPAPAYKILRLLPERGGDYCYRIKSIEEASERVAKESELVVCDDGPARSAIRQRRDVHVARGPETTWLVRRGGQPAELASYRLKAHAMAFARALAFSAGVEMIVHDPNGVVTRHSRASLTYPTSLD